MSLFIGLVVLKPPFYEWGFFLFDRVGHLKFHPWMSSEKKVIILFASIKKVLPLYIKKQLNNLRQWI